MEFKTKNLEFCGIQLIDGDRGKNYPKHTDFTSKGDCLFLSAKNVTLKGFEFSERSFISKEKDASLRAGKIQKGDIIVTTRGTIGNVAFYDDSIPFSDVRINSGMMIFRADPAYWNQRFLYFLLTSHFIKQQIDSLVSGSAVPQLPGRDLKKFQLPEIPMDIQDQISAHIGAIVDKIHLNQQTNKSLEKMAQTLFKSWFVDFDPVFDNVLAKADFNLEALPSAWPDLLLQRATSRLQVLQDNPALQAKLTQANLAETQANTAPEQTSPTENTHQHFPSEFECTDEPSIGINGWIPKGWKEGKLSSIVKFSTDRIDDTKLTLDNYISTDNMLPNKAGVIQASKLPSIKTTPAFDEGHILISNIRPYFKKIWFATSSGGRSNDVLGFIALDKQCNEYVLNLLFQDVFFDYMLATSKGSKMPRGDKTAIMDWNIVIPPNVIQKHYSNFVKDFYQANTIRTNEIGVLTKLRDTLLPKLISGELQTPDVKKPR